MNKFKLKILIIILPMGFLKASPRIVFSETTYDFGRVERGKRIIHYFDFKNEGDEPLLIENVRKSCGCTAARATKKKINPGEKGQIMVVYDSKGFSGKISKYVWVKSNDPNNPNVTLNITGWVEPMYYLNVGFVSFGIIKPDSQPSETVQVTFKKKETKVKNIKANSDYIKITPLGQKDSVYTFVVSLKPNLPEGNFAGRVELTVSNVLDSIIRVAVVAKVAGEIEILPSMIGFGGQRGKTKNIHLKILTSKKIKNMKIDSIYLNNSYISASLDSVKNSSDKIELSLLFNILESAPVGVVQCTLNIYTDNKKYRKIQVPVTGYVR